MSAIKRITDLADYTSVLPYASEMFGVYQPLIGWKSQRQQNRYQQGTEAERDALLYQLGRTLAGTAEITFDEICTASAPQLVPATFAGPQLVEHQSIVLQVLTDALRKNGGMPLDAGGWQSQLDRNVLSDILQNRVLPAINEISVQNCRAINSADENAEQLRAQSQRAIRKMIDDEVSIAGVLAILAQEGRVRELDDIFFAGLDTDSEAEFRKALELAKGNFDDPYLTFDPSKDVDDVSLSPVGVVHLFRQFFFELDTFLGTPTAHVWLSPGSTVELIEVSTRRSVVEKTLETELGSVLSSEKSTTAQDEISDAVKQDNKDDLKLGVTATVNQSWGTGNASATASLNMDKTQQVARESTHKKMRQQSEKLSSEIRQNYKSTFKTVTETTETSSKRYVLTNAKNELINYELRRKMRQVGVQVQDIGSYLCWETFVDDPGADLGLANLVHLAQPADLLPVPDTTEIPYPPDRVVAFQTNAVWDFGNSRQWGFVTRNLIDPPAAPEGYEVVHETQVIPLTQISGNGEDFTGAWAFGGRFASNGQLEVGVLTGDNGLKWNKRVDFVVGGALKYTATTAKKTEIDDANKAKKTAANDASTANDRKTKEAFVTAVRDRIEQAGAIKRRVSEDLREEERIIVYRKLIESLMTSYQYKSSHPNIRHVLSELINSVFDIDKMLYFVAPEWWKPHDVPSGYLSLHSLQSQLNDSLVSWSDGRPRTANYLITDKSDPAVMGSSLGWLLQLDGDALRNAFLNAPWVKAVIPIRPGKEQAAIAWLQNVQVEGSSGLDAAYTAPTDELDAIRTGLGLPAGTAVRIRDAIDFLCQQIADKYEESNRVKQYPATEVNDDNKVSSTPVEKVYEHGFYPLKGGFRVNPNDPAPDPNNTDTNFQVFDQWIEVLPTDQVVPVQVDYDPKTGRQK